MKAISIRLNSFFSFSIIILCISALILNCGGGGGSGSGEVDIANSILRVEPSTLEVGGIQKINVELSEVTQNLAIKLRVPAALQFVSGSAFFEDGENTVATNPAVDVLETSNSSSSNSSSSSSASATPTATATATPTPTTSGSSSSKTTASYEKRYIVFYITKDAFGADPRGTLSFNLRAKNVQEGGRIELDVDLDDPSIPNNREFSVSAPLFEKEQAQDVRIRN